MPAPLDLLLIRHAPLAEPGCLAGRTDAAARIDRRAAAALGASLEPDRLLASPAQRCTATARAVFPGRTVATDPRLWEQDFGRHDGARLDSLPDLGALDTDALAAHRWPGGESFADMAARVAPVIAALTGQVALVAHAGTVRAALGFALGRVAAGLAFEIAPLSLTRLARHPGGWAIVCVNRTAS